jgi:hypothetical protein
MEMQGTIMMTIGCEHAWLSLYSILQTDCETLFEVEACTVTGQGIHPLHRTRCRERSVANHVTDKRVCPRLQT